jgi:hypothetical protein
VVLVAFVLVLLAAASFAAGIAASRTSDTLVYVSIIFSIAAFVVLAIASLRARRAEREGGGAGWAPQPVRTIDETEAHAGPLLGGLDPTQLDMTPSWTRQGRRRWEVTDPDFNEADEVLEEQLENEEDEADFEVPVEPVAAAGRADEFRWGLDDDEEDRQRTAVFTPAIEDDEFDDDDDVLDLPELEAEAEAEAEAEPEVSDEDSFFDEYDDLTAAEILPVLRALDLEGLEWVRARERSGAKRVTVLNQVEDLIVQQGGRATRTSTRKRTTAKKAAPARRAAKKSTRRR